MGLEPQGSASSGEPSRYSSVRDSRKAIRSALLRAVIRNPWISESFKGLSCPTPADGPVTVVRPPLA